MRIWKYPLAGSPIETILTPDTFRPIHVALQDGRITLWAEVDEPLEAHVERVVHVVASGEDRDLTDHAYAYAGTVHILAGDAPNGRDWRPLVWHVYCEVTPYVLFNPGRSADLGLGSTP